MLLLINQTFSSLNFLTISISQGLLITSNCLGRIPCLLRDLISGDRFADAMNKLINDQKNANNESKNTTALKSKF